MNIDGRQTLPSAPVNVRPIVVGSISDRGRSGAVLAAAGGAHPAFRFVLVLVVGFVVLVVGRLGGFGLVVEMPALAALLHAELAGTFGARLALAGSRGATRDGHDTDLVGVEVGDLGDDRAGADTGDFGGDGDQLGPGDVRGGVPYEMTRFVMRADLTGLLYDTPVE